MGLQDLMMFRDNLQQPAPTGMDNLRNLQALTMQGMAAEDYMNEPMMMDTGLMSLPVAQAGFGGFIKSIVKAPAKIVKGVAKGVSGLAKGVAGAVKNIAKSPIGQLAIPAADLYLGPAAFGLPATLGGKAALAAGASGLTSLVGGAKPEDALKRAAIAGALTYGGGKLFGAKGLGGTDVAGKTGFTGDPTGATYGAVGQAQTAGLGLSGAQVGQTFGDASVFTPGGTLGTVGQGTIGAVDTTPLSYGQPFRQVPMVDNVAAQQAAGVGTTPTGIVDTLKAAGSSALDKTKDALMAGVQFARDKPIPAALLGAAALSGLGAGQQIPQDQLAMAGLTPVETDFDK